MINSITKHPWLVGISAMTVAFMAVAFSAVVMQSGSVSAGSGAIGGSSAASAGAVEMMVMSEADADLDIFADEDTAFEEILWTNIQVANGKDLVRCPSQC